VNVLVKYRVSKNTCNLLLTVSIDPWLTIKSASCPLCKHDCSNDVPKSETSEEEEGPAEVAATEELITATNTPPSYSSNSFFSSLPSFRSNNNGSPSSAFGPTISADRAEEFSRSWMARSLPRNMRRQIQEAAQAAAAANRESVIELPARMTQPNTQTAIIDMEAPQPINNTQQQHQQQQDSFSKRFGQRFKRSFPKFRFSSSNHLGASTSSPTHY
jgi:NOL1/NOP2/fmu family ribosome biogenesis protein